MSSLIAPKFLQSLLCHPQQRRRNEVMLARVMLVRLTSFLRTITQAGRRQW
jgi:hypothetical protein